MLDKNSDLARLAFSATWRAFFNSALLVSTSERVYACCSCRRWSSKACSASTCLRTVLSVPISK
ncbi:hypothetical protein D3C80_2140780 [compost metagenome]